ncbi:hypothetical protein JAO76_07565 [Pontibacter sp. BT310]|uniref:Uncharacterized protein n=1 Tax=Pontibacter populi TaxID=890055 RepID=A0ABS6XCI6_9BACT|nr:MULTISPECIES: hypothetical protein [Pontibacter]MBJ6118042.1 hypothetical protein [Pontibacter sp. BT310]MBR0570469.1 hypothetical protein [Microvirga sp. STS03]MBW3364895.1 hypothetical protein [Pontibacter populi]
MKDLKATASKSCRFFCALVFLWLELDFNSCFQRQGQGLSESGFTGLKDWQD